MLRAGMTHNRVFPPSGLGGAEDDVYFPFEERLLSLKHDERSAGCNASS